MKEVASKEVERMKGEQCLGVVLGVALGEGVAGCVGVSGVCGKLAPVPHPPHSFRHTLSWSPRASTTSLTYSN